MPEGAALAEEFIRRGLITRWQADKLLEGRYKGFFLNKYKLLSLLGTGGMSSVFLAENVLMQKRVAVKVLPKHRVDDSSYLERFFNEARAAGRLTHPNIVHTYDIDNAGTHHYIVMEYVPGRNLQQVVKDDGPLSYRRAADYIAQAADGLAHAHDAKLVHRDVKPANFLVNEQNVVKLVDLGLAYFTSSDDPSLTLQHEENVLGTADYLAPEQAVCSHGVDARADIYALGCTLYFLLTGHPPFDEGTIHQRMVAHTLQQPPSIYEDRPDAPRSLVAICERMMAKKPDDRYQTAVEVATVLRDWLIANSPNGDSSPWLGGITASGNSGLRIGRAFDTSTLGDTVSSRDRLPQRGGLHRPLDPGGSSVISRGTRSGGSSGRLRGGTIPSGSGKPVGGELELAPLGDEHGTKPTVYPPSAGNPGATSSPSESGAAAGSATEKKPFGGSGSSPTQTPAKPTDFGTWFEEELSRKEKLPSATAGIPLPATQGPSVTSSPVFWTAMVGGAIVLVLFVLMLVLAL
ncbi:MAG: serine/threonine protein kinase [Pirellulales bacterium]|nr:serine/threonine protein kinase [Pirellulales bacterium]